MNATSLQWRRAASSFRGGEDFFAPPRKAWRPVALAGSVVGLLLVGAWWAGQGRTAARPADPATDSIAAPRRGGAKSAAPRQAPPPRSPRVAVTDAVVPDAYKVLLSRSVFARDGLAASSAPAGAAPRASGFALKGISQEDQRFTAFVGGASAGTSAGTSAGQVMEVHVGDEVAGGRVREITLSDLTLEVGGRVVRVEVGRTFDAAAAAEPQASTR